jgi:hypothetical protein
LIIGLVTLLALTIVVKFVTGVREELAASNEQALVALERGIKL